MAKYVYCTKDLPNGVTAGNRYEITSQDSRSFEFSDDEGDLRFCLKNGCAHLRDGAEWVFTDEWNAKLQEANLNIDVAPATAAMNDFADACERAVAALEKLKEILNK